MPIYAIRPQVLGSTAALGSRKPLITVLQTVSLEGSREFEEPEFISSLTSFPSRCTVPLHDKTTGLQDSVSGDVAAPFPIWFSNRIDGEMMDLVRYQDWWDNNRIPYPTLRICPAVSHLTKGPGSWDSHLPSRLRIEGPSQIVVMIPVLSFPQKALSSNLLHKNVAYHYAYRLVITRRVRGCRQIHWNLAMRADGSGSLQRLRSGESRSKRWA